MHRALARLLPLALLLGCPAEPAPPPGTDPATPQAKGALTRVAFTVDALDLDGEIDAVLWEFGDGNTSTEWDPVHEYDHTGRYAVRVTVWDDGGEAATAKKLIRVRSRPPGVSQARAPDTIRCD